MSLYAIGDLHLSFGTDKPMDVFGGAWADYTDKLTEGFKVLCDDDVCVLCGDTSWGMSLEESLDDFKYIENLPGRKIILKGNHDYWWTTASKMRAFLDANGIKSVEIMHNNCFFYGTAAICGTRGWQFDDEKNKQENIKITTREAGRLRASLTAVKKQADAGEGVTEIICFFHYPPRSGNTVCREIISVMNEHNIKRCYYGHLHGEGHRLAARGIIEGINYDIISADFINFKPQKIL